jgi:hypothetical protein
MMTVRGAPNNLAPNNLMHLQGVIMKFSLATVLTAASIFALGVGSPARAAIVTFSGGDAGANSTDPRPLSDATAASFDTAAAVLGAETLITFESAPVGTYTSLAVAPGVTLTGTDFNGNSSGQSILNTPAGVPDSLFGYNTTSGGINFAFVNGGFITFSFATPIQAFGAYVSGLQVGDATITFDDGSSQTIVIPSLGGGVQFEGFTDAGKLISSVEINTTSAELPEGDFIGVDDVRFVANGGGPATPEASTWVMMLVGFAGLGYVAYVRRGKAPVGSLAA